MIRVKPGRCGYKEYSCVGIPKLTDHMFNMEDDFVSSMMSEFDKLPVKIKGMVFTEDTIDMGWSTPGPHPEVAELTCRSDTDPYSYPGNGEVSIWGSTGIPFVVNGQTYHYPVYGGTTGWADLFNSKISGSTEYFYRNKVYIKITGNTTQYLPIADLTHVPVFITGDTTNPEYEMGPGLLEPMLDTDFDPIGIDQIPAWEAGDDGFIFNNIVIGAWKGVIDDRISNIYARLNSQTPSQQLQGEEYRDSECSNFQIYLTSGAPVRSKTSLAAHKAIRETLPEITVEGVTRPIKIGDIWNSETVVDIYKKEILGTEYYFIITEEAPNRYSISPGNIIVKDIPCTVPGVDNLTAPFYAYLTVSVFDFKESSGTTLPEIVVSGTTRAIAVGDVVADGGTVTSVTSAVVDDSTVYTWDISYDSYKAEGEIKVLDATQLDENQNADPEPGGIGIGGVRLIESSESETAYTLFKVYHEDCISSIDRTDDAVAGYIQIEVSNNTPSEHFYQVPGTTAIPQPGIVQPTRNIEIIGATPSLRSISVSYVPTVEAVFNFIHGYTVYTGSSEDLPVASALADAIGMSVTGSGTTLEVLGHTGTPGTYQVTTDIICTYGTTVTAVGCVPTAQAVVDYVERHITPVSVLGATAGTLINGSTTEEWGTGEPYIDPVTGIVDVSEQIVVGATPGLSLEVVPSVKAVYDFVHGTTITPAYRALVTAGTMSVSGSSISLSGYTPGTSVVVGNISVVNGSTTTNVAYVVPNAKAVVSFVLRDAVPSALEVASASEQSESWKSNWPKPVQSTVEVSSNILIGRTPGISIRAVPSVKAVYDFVHSPDTNTSIAFYGSLAISQIINAPVSGSTYATLAAGALPGTCYVVTDMEGLYGDNVVLQSSYTIDGVVHALVDVVPTAEAVKRYVAAHSGSVAGATAGTLVAGEATEEWSTTSPAVTAVQGIVYTTTTIVVGEIPSISLYAVPTVKAVKDYVDGQIVGATAGYLVLGPMGETLTAAVPGIVGVSKNICISDIEADRSDAKTAVPTVEAVYNFIHGATITDTDTSSALAEAGATTVATSGATSAALSTNAVPGTFYVTNDMTVLGTTVTSYTNPQAVPTAMAVAEYVALRGGGGGYHGPFKVNLDGTVEGGDVYFAGASICTAAKRTTALTTGQTAWLVVSKTGSNPSSYSASIVTGATNTATDVSYPIAKNASGTMLQLHYGVVNITGRWM